MPEIHQAPSPKPLPIPPPRRTEDVFRNQNYNEGGLYQPSTLDAMQDFLLTPLLCEAVTYKLAHQVHNMRLENDHALGPLDLFLMTSLLRRTGEISSSAAGGAG